ncbi:uncharacterized protein DS421_13g400260 [Arachis hypogaea]|nr:uncharacterized protein DS421_13g400260 [Arachis hypogaea]
MDGLLRSSSAFHHLSIFHLIHHPDWVLYRSSSHMSKPRDFTIFSTINATLTLFYIFVPDSIQSHMTTHPSQYLHLCHT